MQTLRRNLRSEGFASALLFKVVRLSESFLDESETRATLSIPEYCESRIQSASSHATDVARAHRERNSIGCEITTDPLSQGDATAATVLRQ